MANRAGHRRFGAVRKLPSGRYQASYPAPDGRRRTAPETFDRKKDADLYLSRVESLISQNEWTDPARAKIRLGDYADRWITERAGLRPRTIELYRWLLGKHITPHLGATALGNLTTPMIRHWRAELLAAGVSETMAAKSYRLLRAVLTRRLTKTGSSRATRAASEAPTRKSLRSDPCSPWRRSSSWPTPCATAGYER